MRYSIGEEFFSGKFNQDSIIIHEGIKFTFTDSQNQGHEHFGPILGLLYTKYF